MKTDAKLITRKWITLKSVINRSSPANRRQSMHHIITNLLFATICPWATGIGVDSLITNLFDDLLAKIHCFCDVASHFASNKSAYFPTSALQQRKKHKMVCGEATIYLLCIDLFHQLVASLVRIVRGKKIHISTYSLCESKSVQKQRWSA